MGKKVYANGREISCKAGAGKSVAAFPDVCLSPPSPPAGPLPIPYPVTAQSSDTAGGSKEVEIGGKEVMLKDRSYFKTTRGDEAATKSFGGGVVTHTINGKVYFTAWSMDVKIEGENAVRHLDLVTHNHASQPGQTPPWPYLEGMATGGGGGDPCGKEHARQADACKEFLPEGDKDFCGAVSGIPLPRTQEGARRFAHQTAVHDCMAASRCALQPMKPTAQEKRRGVGCCKPQTPHHLIEVSSLRQTRAAGAFLKGISGYQEGRAPSICAEGPTQFTGTHGLMHTLQSWLARSCKVAKLELSDGGFVEAPATTYGEARDHAALAVTQVYPESGCSEECIRAQLDAYHGKCGLTDETPIKALVIGRYTEWATHHALYEIEQRSIAVQAVRAIAALGRLLQ